MDRKKIESIREAVHSISRQNIYEIICAFVPLEHELGSIVSNYFVIPPKSERMLAIPLESIYVVMVTNEYVFILCQNDEIHCIDRITKRYESIFPD